MQRYTIFFKSPNIYLIIFVVILLCGRTTSRRYPERAVLPVRNGHVIFRCGRYYDFCHGGQQYLRFRMVFGGWHPYGAAVHLPAVQPDVHHDDSALYSGYVAVVLRHHEICKLL